MPASFVALVEEDPSPEAIPQTTQLPQMTPAPATTTTRLPPMEPPSRLVIGYGTIQTGQMEAMS